MSIRKEAYFFLFAAATLPCFALSPAHAESLAECMAKGNNVTKIDDIFKKYNIKKDNPCPQQSKFDNQEICKRAAKQLEKAAKELEDITRQRCQDAQKLQAKGANDCASSSCFKNANGVVSEADKLNQMELEKLATIRDKTQEVIGYQGDVIEGAYKVQQENVNKAANADGGSKDETLQRMSRAGGTNYSNHQQGRSFFRDALPTISGLVERTRNREITKEDVDQIQTPLAREPAAVAAAAKEFDDMVARRQNDLRTRSAALTQNASTTNQRASDTSSLNAGDLSKTAGLLGSASQLAQAGGGTSGAAAGSDMSSLGGGVTPVTYGDAVSPGGGVSSGGGIGGSDFSGGGGNGGSGGGGGSPDASAVASNGTFIPPSAKSGATTAETLAASKSAELGKNSEAPGSTLTNAAAKDGVAASGASGVKGSALRDALNARGGAGGEATAAAGGGAGSAGGSTSGASLAPGSGANVVEPGSVAGAPLAPFNPGGADTASTEGGVADIGNTDFSLAGSETEEAIKNMVSEFGFGKDDGRTPASAQQAAPEILSADSTDLFTRMRETHQRSLKKGLLINGLRAKL